MSNLACSDKGSFWGNSRMDSYWNRLNTLLCTSLTVLGCAALANHGTSYLYPTNATAIVGLEKVHEFSVNPQLKGDQLTLGFNLKADLTSAVQWNTKQLFTYLIATYSTQKSPRNEVVLWDDIIEDREDAEIHVLNELTDYALRDRYRLLKARSITLGFRYRYIPIMGMMKERMVGDTTFESPHEYFRYQPDRDIEDRYDSPRYLQHHERRAVRGQPPLDQEDEEEE